MNPSDGFNLFGIKYFESYSHIKEANASVKIPAEKTGVFDVLRTCPARNTDEENLLIL
jgi:hypothetical protein